jgi:hypothetical protein
MAQEAVPERAAVAFSDPSKPGKLKIGLMTGGITVRGYEGKEVVVEARMRGSSSRRGRRRDSEEPAGGLRRIPQNVSGFSVEEQDNMMKVSVSSIHNAVDLTVQVPVNTSVTLSTVNDGDIRVERVRGEVEVNNTNGHVTLNNISGSVVAHALNGNLVVTFDEVTANKAMSFTTLNGKIDVTLPGATKARLSMRTDNGEIFSDFEIQMDTSASKAKVEDARGKGGAYRLHVDRTTYGLLNGGGPDFLFKSFNGNIYIRKK